MSQRFINETGVMPIHPFPIIHNPRIRKLNADPDPSVTGDERDSAEIPYLTALDEMINELEAANAKNILIICRGKRTAEKAFTYYMKKVDKSTLTGTFTSSDGRPLGLGTEADEDMRELYLELKKEDSPIYEISLKTASEKIKTGENMYLAGLAELMRKDVNYLYVGLEDGCDIEEKTETIRAFFTGARRFVWITPEQLSQPWVMQLKLCDRFEELKVEDPSDDYYCGFLENLLARTGMNLEDGLTPRDVFLVIKSKLGNLLDETTVDVMMQKAVLSALSRAAQSLKLTDFIPDYDPDNSALKQLGRMTGLEEPKRMVLESVAYMKEEARNPKLKEADVHSNLIFCGNPGTGKTTVARLYARALAETGGKNGVLVIASRHDLIGKYVGHTAAKIASKFEEARGGVLFIDEAGFLINRESGGFVGEGIKEIVRYMETMPDVTVVFAMYAREVEDFLALDEGLRSRISRVVRFEDYTDDELISIARRMCQDRGYTLDDAARSLILNYIRVLKDRDDFGNARDIRRLVDNAVKAHALALHGDYRVGLSGVTDPDVISPADIREGINMSGSNFSDKKCLHRIGFVTDASVENSVLYSSDN